MPHGREGAFNRVCCSQVLPVFGGEVVEREQRKPPPYSGKEEISLTAISPSGFGVGPGRKSGSAMLIFHFGDSALSIELPQSELQTFGQRLMTLAADEGSAQ